MRAFHIRRTLLTLLAMAPAVAASVCLPELEWNTSYNDSSNGADAAVSVAIGSGDSVVAAGYEYRGSPDQGQNWLIRKFSSAGALLWSRDYNGAANGNDRAYGTAVDADGNIVVVGMENRSDIAQGQNWMVRKYDPDGNWLWGATYNSPADADDCALAVAVDSAKNIIVAGFETRSDIYQQENWVIRKYDAAGNLLWHKAYDGSASRTDKAFSVVVDGADNIVVAGSEYRMASLDDWRIRKFSPAGVEAWNVTYDGVGGKSDMAFAVDVAVTGTIYVAGYVTGFSGTGEDWHIRAYSASGADLWDVSYNNPADSADRAYGLAVDNYGNVLAAGAEGTGGDWLIRKYSKTGSYLCSVAYAGPGGSADAARSLAIDAANRCVVAGEETGIGSEGLNWRLRRYLQPTACLEGQINVAPWPVYAGQWLSVSFTVSNNGDLAAASVTPALDINGGASSVTVLAAPGVISSMAAGTGTTFVWTCSVSGNGTLLFTATATGTDSGTSLPVMVSRSQGVIAKLPARLEASLAGVPAFVKPGQWFQLVLTLTNTGDVSALAVSPSHEINSGGSYVNFESGPSPAGGSDLDAGLARSFTWTYSASGAGAVSFTGTGSGTDSGTSKSLLAADGAAVMIYEAELEAGLEVSPGEAAVGQWVSVSLSLTNSGIGDFSSIAPDLEINSGTSLVSPVAGPSPADLSVLAAGSSTKFVWTFSVSGAGTVSFTASAAGSDFASGNPLVAAASGQLTGKGLAALTAQLSVGPDPAVVGQWVKVFLTVTNTGDFQADAVSGTLEINSGAAYLDPQDSYTGPLSLAPGGATTFVWTYSVSGAGAVAFTGTASGTDSYSSGPIAAWASGGLTTLDSADLRTALAVSSSLVEAGQWVTVSLTVTNTGGYEASSVTPSIEANAGNALFAWQTGPLPPGPVDLAPAGATTFVWSFSVSGAGSIRLTATASGSNLALGRPVVSAASVSLLAAMPGRLASRLYVDPMLFVTGNWISTYLSVTNTGGVAVENVSASIQIDHGGPVLTLVGGPVPSGTVFLGPSESQTFSWTYSVTGCGDVFFTATPQGADAWTGAPVSAPSSAQAIVKGDAWDPVDDTAGGGTWLVPGSALLAHGPHSLCSADAADWFRLNLSAGEAYRFDTAGGAGDCYAALYSDSLAADLVASDDDGAGGGQFYFEYTPAVSKTYYLKVAHLTADWAGSLNYQRRAQACLSAAPSPAAVGQWIQVVLTASNSGAASLESVSGYLAVTAGASLLTPVASPSGTVSIASGGAQFLTWTFSVSGAGTVAFTASAAGVDGASGRPVRVETSADISCVPQPLANLDSRIAILPSLSLVEGQWLTLHLTVTNTGDAQASNVFPALAALGAGGGAVDWVYGPSPAGPVSLDAGASRTFTWTYSVSGAGYLTYSATVTGADAASGTALRHNPAPVLLTLARRSTLLAELILPSSAAGPVREQDTFTVALKITNTGGNEVSGVSGSLSLSSAALATVLTAPAAGELRTLAPGADTSFTWTMRAERAGPLGLTGAASGRYTGGVLAAQDDETLVVMVTPTGSSAYPNPVSGDSLKVALKLKATATEVTVDVYNAALERIFHGAWGNVLDSEGQVTVHGVSAWAPGMYILRAEAKYADGSRQGFPVMKVMVKR